MLSGQTDGQHVTCRDLGFHLGLHCEHCTTEISDSNFVNLLILTFYVCVISLSYLFWFKSDVQIYAVFVQLHLQIQVFENLRLYDRSWSLLDLEAGNLICKILGCSHMELLHNSEVVFRTIRPNPIIILLVKLNTVLSRETKSTDRIISLKNYCTTKYSLKVVSF